MSWFKIARCYYCGPCVVPADTNTSNPYGDDPYICDKCNDKLIEMDTWKTQFVDFDAMYAEGLAILKKQNEVAGVEDDDEGYRLNPPF